MVYGSWNVQKYDMMRLSTSVWVVCFYSDVFVAQWLTDLLGKYAQFKWIRNYKLDLDVDVFLTEQLTNK